MPEDRQKVLNFTEGAFVRFKLGGPIMMVIDSGDQLLVFADYQILCCYVDSRGDIVKENFPIGILDEVTKEETESLGIKDYGIRN